MTDFGQADIADLNVQIDTIEDPRESYALVRDRIEECKRGGGDVPEELTRLERTLATECLAESQGR